MGVIKERYCKTEKLHNSQSFYFTSANRTASILLVWHGNTLLSSEIKTFHNVMSEPNIPFYIKQEPGNSNKEEFDRMMKLALEHK